jgi:Ca2+-binding EF-hand superfamily protein
MRRFTLTCCFAGLLALGAVDAQAQDPGRGGRPGPGGQGGPGGRGFMMSPLMTALDTDGDGELSAKEIDAASVTLKTLDKDKDGKLSAEELRPAGGFGGRGGMGGGNATQRLTAMLAFDKDGDGKVSKAELPERLQNLMATGDTNKDGFLDKAELTKIAETRAAAGGGFGGRGGRGGPGGPGGGTPRDN